MTLRDPRSSKLAAALLAVVAPVLAFAQAEPVREGGAGASASWVLIVLAIAVLAAVVFGVRAARRRGTPLARRP